MFSSSSYQQVDAGHAKFCAIFLFIVAPSFLSIKSSKAKTEKFISYVNLDTFVLWQCWLLVLRQFLFIYFQFGVDKFDHTKKCQFGKGDILSIYRVLFYLFYQLADVLYLLTQKRFCFILLSYFPQLIVRTLDVYQNLPCHDSYMWAQILVVHLLYLPCTFLKSIANLILSAPCISKTGIKI